MNLKNRREGDFMENRFIRADDVAQWNQWVSTEKSALAFVMERHGIEWEHKGTHEKHLSVLEISLL